jgi:hypothetical protein
MENKDQTSMEREPALEPANVVEVEPTVFDEIVAASLETDDKVGKHVKKHKMRKLCKLVKKDFMDDHFEEFKALVTESKWVCRECGRASNDPARLHAPISLEKSEEEAPGA